MPPNGRRNTAKAACGYAAGGSRRRDHLTTDWVLSCHLRVRGRLPPAYRARDSGKMTAVSVVGQWRCATQGKTSS